MNQEPFNLRKLVEDFEYFRPNNPTTHKALEAAHQLQEWLDRRVTERVLVTVDIEAHNLTIDIEQLTIWDSEFDSPTELDLDSLLARYRNIVSDMMTIFVEE